MEDFFKKKYISNNKRSFYLIITSTIIAIVVALLSFSVTQYDLTLSEAYQIIINQLNGVIPEDYKDRLEKFIVWDGLVPRAIVGAFVGAVLAIGGGMMQTIIRNPLTDSYTTGISAGALFGVTISVALGINIIPVGGNLGIIVNAFAFSLIPTSLIIIFAMFKKVSPTIMVLIGIAVMYIFTAATTLIKYTATEEDLAAIYEWSLGSLGKSSWDILPYILIAMFIISIGSLLTAKSLNALSSGDNTAKSLGVNPNSLRISVLILISLVTAIVVCFTGTIGFVGLVSPHIARILVGSNVKYMIPASASIGALMLIGSDCVSRVIGLSGLPVGVVTAIIGGPIFLYLLVKQRKSCWK